MRDPFSKDRFWRPERFWDDFIRKGVKGFFVERDESVPFLFRALVIGVDTDGGKLENPDGNGSVTHTLNGQSFDVPARVGPENPPNSIKARVLTDGLDRFFIDEELRVFWPFFPDSLSIPVKPGEHVYVVFEDQDKTHGLWVSKVPGHVGVNYVPGETKYVPPDQGALVDKFPDTSSANASGQKPPAKNEDAAETKSGNKLTRRFSG